MIYTREQLIHELMIIIGKHDYYKPNYTYDLAKAITDLIATLDDDKDPAELGIFP